MTDLRDKRWRIYTLTGEALAAALKSQPNTLPEDARYVRATADFGRDCFLIVFESETFEPVPEGCRIPKA